MQELRSESGRLLRRYVEGRWIRFERDHNGHIIPTNWNGRGQPTKHTRSAPTYWRVLVHDPVRWEGCEVLTFDSIEEREAFIESYMQ